VLHILGIGECHPENVIDNKFLEDLDIGSSGDWIIDKIGIRERRTNLPLDYIRDTKNVDPRKSFDLMEMTPTEMGAKASEVALERAGVSAGEVGLVICNCCTPYMTVPSEAQRIARAIGSSGVAYDVFTACPAFALHLDHIHKCKEGELPDFILCVSTASLTHKVNYNERSDSAI